MRWKNRAHLVGQERDIERFAFFPTEIDTTVVWLEKYIVHEKFIFGSYSKSYYWMEVYKILKNK